MIRRFVFILLVTLFHSLKADDSTTVFSSNQLLLNINSYHPVVKQSFLLIDERAKQVMKSRGGLDPFLYSDFQQKQFESKEYFTLLTGGLKIPTWIGADVTIAYDYNRGFFLNPENNIPSSGLLYSGISVPIGQGLFFDNRRAVIKQAELMKDAGLLEQKQIINNLYSSAFSEYWQWAAAYEELQLYKQSVTLASERLKGIKSAFVLGDIPAIDTLEAFIQLQNRVVNYSQSEAKYKNQLLSLSTHLWFDNNIPLEIPENFTPSKLDFLNVDVLMNTDSLAKLLNTLDLYHPDLLLYNNKLEVLTIQKKWQVEKLKPVVNVNYNFLTSNIDDAESISLSTNNYKWGLNVAMPLYLRDARAGLAINKINTNETLLEKDIRRAQIINGIKALYNELLQIQFQIQNQQQIASNYEVLLNAEKIKFFNGESSVFLINNRESQYIQAVITLIHMRLKFHLHHIKLKQTINNWGINNN